MMPTIIHGNEFGEQQFFSKGVLAHRLTNIGLVHDSVKAYRIAFNVEKKLNKERISEITSLELIDLVTQEILEEIGSTIADRYNISSRLNQEGKALTIVLIGTIGVGKGTLAHNLASIFSISRILGTDVIYNLMRDLISPLLVPELQKPPLKAYQGLRSIYSSIYDPLLIGFDEVSKIIDAGVRSVIHRSEREQISTVIRGAHFSLKNIGSWLLEQPNVFPFMISLQDEEAHNARLLKDEEKLGEEEKTYSDQFESIRKVQDYLLEGSEEIGIEVIENLSTTKTIEQILDIIIEKLKGQFESSE